MLHDFNRKFAFVSLLSLCFACACSDTGGTILPDTASMPNPDGGSSADLIPTTRSCEATSPRAVPLEIEALPDAGEEPLVAVIEAAQTTLRVFCYLMGRGGIIDGLKKRAEDGLDVRVIIDQRKKSTNEKYYDELKAAGVQIIWSDPKFQYMHAKVIIADDTIAVASTGNYSYTYSINKERNFVTTIKDPQDIGDLVAIFDSDWNGEEPTVDCTRLLVSPVNAKERLVALIESAETKIQIFSMQMADWDIRNAVTARADAGIEVVALLADPDWIDANSDAAEILGQHGVTVRWTDTPPVHTKALVVDEKSAYVGSVNFSYTSLNKNREVGFVTGNAAAVGVITSTFNKDWQSAQSFP
jgi:cardiolipin synthase A/B